MVFVLDTCFLPPEIERRMGNECLFLFEPGAEDWDSFELFYRFQSELISQYFVSLR